MNAKQTLSAELNAAFYAAATKAGCADVLRRYSAEVWVSMWEGKASVSIVIEEEQVNADHECDVPVPASLRPSIARAEKWLKAFCAAKHPAVTVNC